MSRAVTLLSLLLPTFQIAEAVCGSGHDRSKCQEQSLFGWNDDGDCCATNGNSRCKNGYTRSITADNGCMWNRGTCCTSPSAINSASSCDASRCQEEIFGRWVQ